MNNYFGSGDDYYKEMDFKGYPQDVQGFVKRDPIKPPIGKLPVEDLEKILSYLDSMSLQQAALVSKDWSSVSIDTAKHEEFSKIKNFANFLGEKLPESYPTQKKQLLDIGNGGESKILESVSLLEVKSSIKIVNETIVNVLKDLKDEDLKELESASKGLTTPQFFEDVFELARLYKNLDEINKITDERKKSLALSNFSIQLLNSDKVDHALKIAKLIPREDYDLKENALSYISTNLLRQGKVDKGLEIANDLPVSARDKIFNELSFQYLRMGQIEDTLKFVKMINDDEIRESSILQIIQKIAEREDIDKALEVAVQYVADNKELLSFLYSLKAAKTGNIEDSIKFAGEVTDEKLRMSVLKKVGPHCYEIAKNKQDVDILRKLFNLIDDVKKRDDLLRVSSIDIAELGNINMAKELANLIVDTKTRDSTLKSINLKS